MTDESVKQETLEVLSGEIARTKRSLAMIEEYDQVVDQALSRGEDPEAALKAATASRCKNCGEIIDSYEVMLKETWFHPHLVDGADDARNRDGFWCRDGAAHAEPRCEHAHVRWNPNSGEFRCLTPDCEEVLDIPELTEALERTGRNKPYDLKVSL